MIIHMEILKKYLISCPNYNIWPSSPAEKRKSKSMAHHLKQKEISNQKNIDK